MQCSIIMLPFKHQCPGSLQEPVLFPLLFSLPSLFSTLPSLCVFTHFCSPFFFITNFHFLRAGTRRIQILFFDRRVSFHTQIYSIYPHRR